MYSILFIILAAICDAIKDKISFHLTKSIFKKYKDNKWINPDLSWKNKYYFNNKFLTFIFSTVLVWTTDLWHFCKFLYIKFLILAIILYSPVITCFELDIINKLIEFFGLWILYSGTFELFFGFFFNKE